MSQSTLYGNFFHHLDDSLLFPVRHECGQETLHDGNTNKHAESECDTERCNSEQQHGCRFGYETSDKNKKKKTDNLITNYGPLLLPRLNANLQKCSK